MEKGFTVDMYGYLMAVWTAASLVCVVVLGVVKLTPKARFWVMAGGFTGSVLFFILTYLSTQFIPLCIMAFLASFTNCAGNTVYNASLMLALPEKNRGAILGFIQEYRTERTLIALKNMTAPTAKCFRDGALQTIPAANLVKGDIIRLEAGDKVPADCVLLEAKGVLAEVEVIAEL